MPDETPGSYVDVTGLTFHEIHQLIAHLKDLAIEREAENMDVALWPTKENWAPEAKSMLWVVESMQPANHATRKVEGVFSSRWLAEAWLETRAARPPRNPFGGVWMTFTPALPMHYTVGPVEFYEDEK